MSEYEEETKKINIRISEIERERFNYTQGIEEKFQQYVEAAVGEGSAINALDDQKKYLDD
ncbi:MAG: hypothetical protein PG981_001200 [Wolbachia endosymbiont of Ctenocephalides orientis wCori]|nr:MAG: hypothetical protein PG981_001200 [Wolbachia endosymbiont of Ctenocephalides orientis wCori]